MSNKPESIEETSKVYIIEKTYKNGGFMIPRMYLSNIEELPLQRGLFGHCGKCGWELRPKFIRFAVHARHYGTQAEADFAVSEILKNTAHSYRVREMELVVAKTIRFKTPRKFTIRRKKVEDEALGRTH